MNPEKLYIELPVIINSSSKINGDLEFSSEVLIDGEACGKLTSEKRITIGSHGFFKGTLHANDLVVFGRLDGDIIVSENVILHSSCTIDGCIYTKHIDLKEGANLNAQVIMSENPKATYSRLMLMPENESFAEMPLKKGRRFQPPAYNPGNFFAKVFKEMDLEMVTAQIYYSTSTDLKKINPSVSQNSSNQSVRKSRPDDQIITDLDDWRAKDPKGWFADLFPNR